MKPGLPPTPPNGPPSNQIAAGIDPGENPLPAADLPDLDGISEISVKNSQSPADPGRHSNMGAFDDHLKLEFPAAPANRPSSQTNLGAPAQPSFLNAEATERRPAPEGTPLVPRIRSVQEIYVKSRNSRQAQKMPTTGLQTFLEDMDISKVPNLYFSRAADPNQKPSSRKADRSRQEAEFAEQPLRLKSFSFQHSKLSNSRDMIHQGLFRKKKGSQRFTEVGGPEAPRPNDTSINIGLPAIPIPGIVHLPNNPSMQNLSGFLGDKSFNNLRQQIRVGPQQDFLSNFDKSFQRANESQLPEFPEIDLRRQGAFSVMNQSVLAHLNAPAKGFGPNPEGSFQLDKNMPRLDRIDNSFNLSMNRHGIPDFAAGLNDTLNQSELFKMRQASRTNLDSSFNFYRAAPKKHMLNTLPPNADTPVARPGLDPNTSFDQEPQNILSLLDKEALQAVIPEQQEEEAEARPQSAAKSGAEQLPKEEGFPGKFFMDPQLKERGKAHAKVKRADPEGGGEEGKAEGAGEALPGQGQGKDLKNSDILRYIIQNYNAQCISNVVNAKCAKYMKKKPDIYEMINSVISKNKKWKRILEIVRTELAREDSSEDSRDLKGEFAITTEQKASERRVVNKIRINFNTEIKCERPSEKQRQLRRERRRRHKRRRLRRTRETEDALLPRTELSKAVQGYSQKFSSSRGSDSGDRVVDCKRVKRQSVTGDASDPNRSFFSGKSDAKQRILSELFGGRAPPSELGDLSETPGEDVVTVVRNPARKGAREGLLSKREGVKRRRGRPKESRNPRQGLADSRRKRPSSRRRKRRLKGSLREAIKDIILNEGKSFEPRSDSRSGRSRPKKSEEGEWLKGDEDFAGMRGNKKMVFDLLRVTFTEMRVKTQSQADFLNSGIEEARVLRVILQKKFELKAQMEPAPLQLKKEKKRNEEINKFVVKRCMKFFMKRNREGSIDPSRKSPPSVQRDFSPKPLRRPPLAHQDPKETASAISAYRKEALPEGLAQKMGSFSNISAKNVRPNSPSERNLTNSLRPGSSKMMFDSANRYNLGGRSHVQNSGNRYNMGSLSIVQDSATRRMGISESGVHNSANRMCLPSQSDFPNLRELNDEVVPGSSAKDLSFNRGIFGPAPASVKLPKSPSFLSGLQSKPQPALQPPPAPELKTPPAEPKENTKLVAHSKLLSEHQFYVKFFQSSATEAGEPLEKFYLPNTKLANKANRENKGNKQAQSFKTINIKYIRLILRSRVFADAIRNFLENTFEFEYRETRVQKLRLLAKRIKDAKYIRSVKLPWTMHEILEAKVTFLRLIETTEQDFYGRAPRGQGRARERKADAPGARKKSRSGKRSGRRAPPAEENFQKYFAEKTKSNKFLNS